MRSSDTPTTDHGDDELRGPQGPADWDRQPFSDRLLSENALARLAELARLAQHIGQP